MRNDFRPVCSAAMSVLPEPSNRSSSGECRLSGNSQSGSLSSLRRMPDPDSRRVSRRVFVRMTVASQFNDLRRSPVRMTREPATSNGNLWPLERGLS